MTNDLKAKGHFSNTKPGKGNSNLEVVESKKESSTRKQANKAVTLDTSGDEIQTEEKNRINLTNDHQIYIIKKLHQDTDTYLQRTANAAVNDIQNTDVRLCLLFFGSSHASSKCHKGISCEGYF